MALPPHGVTINNTSGIFSGITIQNNNISDTDNGAIIFIHGASPRGEADTTEDVSIVNNTVDSNTADGIAFTIGYGKLDDITIENNSISDNGSVGVQVVAQNSAVINNTTIANNTISGNLDGLAFAAYGGNASLTAGAYRNTITDNTRYGVVTDSDSLDNVLTADLGGGDTGSIGYNSIYDNVTYDLISDLTQDVSVSAESNWWGQSTGPEPAKISGDIDYTPWLTSDPNL